MFNTMIWFTIVFLACLIASVAFEVLTNEDEEIAEYITVNGVTYVVIDEGEG